MTFLGPEQITEEHPIGGKGRGLWLLNGLGAPVPPWVVLPADGADDFLAHPSCADTLARLYAQLDGGAGIAVRSSSLLEDQRTQSRAGAFETRFCAHADALSEAIASVLASGAGPANSSKTMGVILQRRITPILSGVLFSAHPSHARPDQAYVEFLAGSPEGLVDGTRAPGTALIDPFSGKVEGEGAEGFADEVAAALCEWLLPIETKLGCAADIEWAVDDEGPWLLQARPVTRLYLDPALLPEESATSWFFDQRFSEPLRPITRSALLPLILQAGISEALAMRSQAPPDTLAYDYGGIPYVPVATYEGILNGLPTAWLTADVGQIFSGDRRGPRYLPRPGALLNLIGIVWRERAHILFNLRAWRTFRDGLAEALAAIPDADSEYGDAWRRAWTALDGLTRDFLRIHRWSIMLADGAYALWPKSGRHGPHLVTQDANTALECLRAGAAVDETFIRRYGHRSMSLDFATPTWGEREGGLDLPALPTMDGLAGPNATRGILAGLLALREEQRFVWEMILARQRRLLLRAGAALCAHGCLETREDVWWLTWDELVAMLEGGDRIDGMNLRRRQREHHIYQTAHRPPRIGPPRGDPAMPTTRDNVVGTWSGLGASAGAARGRALVLRRPGDFQPVAGEDTILVLPSLDPACTAVMTQVVGLVIERGGLLSHAAIVAREYGIPLVIGVPDIMTALVSGDCITIDGRAGTIRIDG